MGMNWNNCRVYDEERVDQGTGFLPQISGWFYNPVSIFFAANFEFEEKVQTWALLKEILRKLWPKFKKSYKNEFM